MATRALHGEDYAGLVLALALHAGLVALLVMQPGPAKAPPLPERISVTLAEESALQSTSPEPQAAAAAPAAPIAAPEPEPEPQPSAAPPSPTPPKALPKVLPKAPPKVQPQVRPVATPAPQPRPAPKALPRTPAPPQPRAAAVPRPAPAQRPAARPAAASRISDDFLKGIPGAPAAGTARNPPAAAIGPAVRSALSSAISRELKPHWAAPQGAEAELLVTVVRFRLARDGSLAGEPEIVRQSGETAANRAQLQRHREQAVRAIRLAAPFDLPVEFYAGWQVVTSTFDKRLSQ